MTVADRAKNIKLLLLDVDGVLTDGRIIYTGRGDDIKFFHSHDGLGMSLWWRSGGKSAILSAKESRTILRRVKDMHITKVYQSAENKLDTFRAILKDFAIEPREAAFIGDDLLDIPVLKTAGLAVAVQDAAAEVKDAAHYITQKPGGKGAVRETVEMILKAQGKWGPLISEYLS